MTGYHKLQPTDEIELQYVEIEKLYDLPSIDEIEAYWDQLTSASPELFNGETVIGKLEKNRLTYTHTNFQTFLYLKHHEFLKENEGILGFKVLLHHDEKILVGLRSEAVSYQGGYYSTIGGTLEQLSGWTDMDVTIYQEIKEETGISLQGPITYHQIGIDQGTSIIFISTIELPQPLESYNWNTNWEWEGDFLIVTKDSLSKLQPQTQELNLIDKLLKVEK